MTESNRALVAHLFRRGGFGQRTTDADAYPVGDYLATVEALVAPAIAKRDDQPATVLAAKDAPATTSELRDAQTAWVRSMVSTRAPLVERMTLFLSNHFATAFNPALHVDAGALVAQHGVIRKHALGSFSGLTHAMLDDLALACYLNNNRNHAKRPNENLGRELMELFLLGPGNYTEFDVKEVSRALTGYRVEKLPGVGARLVYKDEWHDNGLKTVLGKTAAFTPHQVVDHLLAQPVAKRFLATKLVGTFVSPTPDPVLVGTVAKTLQNWELSAALRAIFYSSHFRSAEVRNALPKTPAEFVVGIMRGLRRTEYGDAVGHMTAAGHALFRPPSVAGWPMGKRMLGPGAMLARYNAASRFAYLHLREPAAGLPKGPDVGRWTQEFGITALSQPTIDAIAAYKRDAARLTTAGQTAGVLTLLLASPDFQLS